MQKFSSLGQKNGHSEAKLTFSQYADFSGRFQPLCTDRPQGPMLFLLYTTEKDLPKLKMI